jgi:cell division FtsZ-interacting protein ZapD
MQSWSYAVGMIMGSVAVVSASYVWVKHQRFGIGGAFLSFVGVVLLGLSVWSRARVEISEDGVLAEFERIQQRLEDVTRTNDRVQRDLDSLQIRLTASEQQFLAMARVLRDKSLITGVDLKRVTAPGGVP